MPNLALLLGGFGAHLALSARRWEPMEEVARALSGSNVQVLIYPADVSDRAAMEAMARLFEPRVGSANVEPAHAPSTMDFHRLGLPLEPVHRDLGEQTGHQNAIWSSSTRRFSPE